MKGIFLNVFVWRWFVKVLDRTSTSSLVEGNLEHEEDDQMQDIVLERKWINLFIAIVKNFLRNCTFQTMTLFRSR